MKSIQALIVPLIGIVVLVSPLALAQESPTINMNDMPKDYIQGSGETLHFKTAGVSDHAVLIYEAYDSSTQPWTRVEGFLGEVGSYRGGLRFIPPHAMDKLPPGVWMLRVYVLDEEETEVYVAVTVAQPKPVTDQEALRELLEEAKTEVVDEPAETEPTPAENPADGDVERPADVLPVAPPPSEEPTPEIPPTIPPPPAQPVGKGFTDYKTSSDSKVIYVPSGSSIRSGYDQLRDGYPDHLLLQAGGNYTLSGGLKWGKSGRSSNEPMVFGVIGNGARPVIHTTGSGITFSGTVKNTAFVGLHLTADDRNPNHPSYTSDCPRYDGFSLYAAAINFTIEDCLVEYFTHGVLLEGANDANIRLHRSIIRRSWSQSSKGHSQGLYGLRVSNLVITDCLFDQNGWEPKASGGGRTIFNHNIYVIGTKGLLIDNSLFTRGSSYGVNLRTGSQSGQDQVNITIRNSLFLDNANTIAAGGKVPEIVSKNLNISDCVFTRHGAVINGMVQSLGINGFCWDGIDISRNVFFDKSFGGTSFAVKFEPGNGPVRNGKINDNVVHGWLLSETAIQPSGSNMSASGNYINQSTSIYADGSRTLDTYLKSVGAGGGTGGFIEWAASRPRGVWESRPYDFVNYVQAGFTPKY